MEDIIDFIDGALTVSYFLAGVFFLRFWRKTGDRLFVHFAIAFWLFAINQVGSFVLGTAQEAGYFYILRVAGYLLIIAAIIGKNAGAWSKHKM